jgi:dsRNA-specific ribonuclease
MILKEYGDDIGEQPEYTSDMISLEPPVFKERVTLQGVTEEGTGRTRKEAKHRASQKACQRMRLPEN